VFANDCGNFVEDWSDGKHFFYGTVKICEDSFHYWS